MKCWEEIVFFPSKKYFEWFRFFKSGVFPQGDKAAGLSRAGDRVLGASTLPFFNQLRIQSFNLSYHFIEMVLGLSPRVFGQARKWFEVQALNTFFTLQNLKKSI